MPWDSLGSHSQWHNLDFPGSYDVCRSAFNLCNTIRIDLNGGRTYLAYYFRDSPPWFIVLAALGAMTRQNIMMEHLGLATSHTMVMRKQTERERWMTLVTHFSFTGPYLLPTTPPTGVEPLTQQLEGTFTIRAIATCLCGDPFALLNLFLFCYTLSGTCYLAREERPTPVLCYAVLPCLLDVNHLLFIIISIMGPLLLLHLRPAF